MKQITKKFVSFVMALTMVLTMVPTAAFAEETNCNHTHTAECFTKVPVADDTTTAPQYELVLNCSHEHNAECLNQRKLTRSGTMYSITENLDYLDTMVAPDPLVYGVFPIGSDGYWLQGDTQLIAGRRVLLIINPADGYTPVSITIKDDYDTNKTLALSSINIPMNFQGNQPFDYGCELTDSISSNYEITEVAYKSSITVNSATGGSVSASASSAIEGETVTLTVNEESGYTLKSITIKDDKDNSVDYDENTSSFIMPERKVTVTPEFEQAAAATYKVTIEGDRTTAGFISFYEDQWGTAERTFAAGETIYLQLQLTGYNSEIKEFTVTDENGNLVPLTGTFVNHEDIVSFTMPSYNVIVKQNVAPIDRKVKIADSDNGTVTFAINGTSYTDEAITYAGQSVDLYNTPDEGYEFVEYIVEDSNGNAPNFSSSMTFEMPKDDVTVSALFKALPGIRVNVVDENGDPVDGVSVSIYLGTGFMYDWISGTNGKYSNLFTGGFTVDSTYDIVVDAVPSQYVVPATKTVTLTESENQPTVTIVLEEVPDYKVTITGSNSTYGYVYFEGDESATEKEFAAGETVTLKLSVADHYDSELKDVTVTDGSGNSILYTGNLENDGDTATFTMPSSNVTITYEAGPVDRKAKVIDPVGGTVTFSINGTIYEDEAITTASQRVDIYNTPDEGYEFVEYIVKDSEGNTPYFTTPMSFNMPADDVTISAVFRALPGIKVAVVDENGHPVNDVKVEFFIDGGWLGEWVSGTNEKYVTFNYNLENTGDITIDVAVDKTTVPNKYNLPSPQQITLTAAESRKEVTFTLERPSVKIIAEDDLGTAVSGVPFSLVNGTDTWTWTSGTTEYEVKDLVNNKTYDLTIPVLGDYVLGSVSFFLNNDGSINHLIGATYSNGVIHVPLVKNENVLLSKKYINHEETNEGSVVFTVNGSEVTKATYGDEVTVTVTPPEDYAIDNIYAVGDVVSLTPSAEGVYTFTMPDEGVQVSVDFVSTIVWVQIDVDEDGDFSIDTPSVDVYDKDGSYVDEDDTKYIPVYTDDNSSPVQYVPDGVLADDDNDGIWMPDNEAAAYVPKDKDNNGDPTGFIHVADNDGKGVYEDENGDKYIPSQDGDGEAIPVTENPDGSYKDEDDNTYIPTYEGIVEVTKDEDGNYEDEDGNKYVKDEDGYFVKAVSVEINTASMDKAASDGKDYIVIDEILSGAELKIVYTDSDENEVIVDEWTSDGEAHKTALLAEDKEYTLKVVKNPDGFGADREEIPFNIHGGFLTDENGNYYVTFTRTMFQLFVEGSDGKNIDGAVLRITDKDGNDVLLEEDTAYENSYKLSTSGENTFLSDPVRSSILSDFNTNETYTIHSDSVPTGYKVFEPADIALDVNGRIDWEKTTAEPVPFYATAIAFITERVYTDDDNNGIYEDANGDNFVPVDKNEDGRYSVEDDEFVKVTDDDNDNIYEDEDGNKYYPDDYEEPSRPSRPSSSGGSTGHFRYKVNVETTENGYASSDKKAASSGEKVTITVNADNGYTSSVKVTDKLGRNIEITKTGEDTYSFLMPASEVTVKAVFSEGKKEIDPDKVAIIDAIILTINEKGAWVFGKYVENDVPPVIRNSRTMLPIRFVAENLGAVVGWDDALDKVTITKGEKLIEIYIDSATAYVNGEAITLDSPAYIENSRTYLPLRFVAENLDATVLWKATTHQVYIIPVENIIKY